MKNIIKTAICLIVISSILLYSSVSKAAQSDINIIAPSYNNAVLIDNQIGSTENNYQSTATYEVNTNLHAHINAQDGYYTGYYSFYIIATNETLPSNWMLGKMDCYFTPENNMSNQYRVTTVQDIQGGNLMYITMYMDNLPCFGSNFELGSLTVRLTCYANSNSNVVAPSGIRINYSVNYEIDRKNFTAIPQTSQGYGLLYKQFITDALHVGKVDLIYDYLVNWKTTQDLYLADIVLSTDDVETWLSYINSAQATLQNKVDLIYTLEQTFPGYFNSIISILQQIRDMNASDTEAESEMQNAEQQLSQAVNDMEVQKPNINNVVNAGDQYMDSNITGAQGDTFFWLHGTNIFVTILTMAVTIGILGFVIYGKSG